MRGLIARYVAAPSPEALDAVTLWVTATHLQTAFQHAPRLAIVGPAKRCGKSRLLDVITETVHHPVITINATPAAVFRSITEQPPTLLVDEADTLFGSVKALERNEELRGLLNAGHQRNRPTLRVTGSDHTVKSFPTFAMAALAGIGDLPDTIMDRAVVVRMRRRAPGEHVTPFRTGRDVPDLHALRRRIAAWAIAVRTQAAAAEPELPVEDRAADTWEPLVIVADLAGGRWPQAARAACTAMTRAEQQAEADASESARILADCRAVFAANSNPVGMTTDQLLHGLRSLEESPWTGYGHSGLTARDLGALLRPYGIASTNLRLPDGSQRKGYARSRFADAWQRYCPDLQQARLPVEPVG
ncbi:hypothetical protein BIV57_03965 [Mangrovactinospora gilvigrisea]|uniref:DUF3631 domain-containing protein n=1 Tax=Mangrovactinospora gilvigrisea TaxID=1428644 RepID=A0A1J7CB98_9ACTN|nr:hypothetical protein BIV57_03965 [Mangrovactinospora gilvigrisea]